MNVKLIFLITCIFCLSAWGAPSESLTKLRYCREILPSEDAKSSDVSAVVFDDHIFQNTNSSFSDLRILGAGHIEIPFVTGQEFVSEKKEELVHCGVSKISSLKKLDNNSVEFIAELTGTESLTPSGIEFLTGNRNYEKKIDVLGSNDSLSWKQLASNQTIFDYSEIIMLSKNTVRIDPELFRFYRIVIANFSEDKVSPISEIIKEQRKDADFSRIEKIVLQKEPLKIDDIQFLARKELILPKTAKTKEYSIKFTTKTDDKGNTEIIVESDYKPLTSFLIETASVNFSRQVTVECGNDRKNWEALDNSGKISKIDISGFKETKLKINIPEKRSAFYRLKIINGDAPAIQISSVKACGNIYFAKFLNQKGKKTFIYYSGKEIELPQYDIAGILSKINNPTLGILKLGIPVENPDFNKQILKKPFFDNKTLFYGVIVLMVIILGFAIFRNIKKIDSTVSE